MGRKIPEIEEINIKIEPDDGYNALDHLGEYTDKSDDWNICRRCGKYVKDHVVLRVDEGESYMGTELCFYTYEDWKLCDWHDHREYQYFKPYAGGEDPEKNEEDYRKYGLQDYKRMEQFIRGDVSLHGITAEAVCITKYVGHGRLQRLTSGGLWGIESDCGNDYVRQVIEDELLDLAEHLENYGVDLKGFAEKAEQAREKVFETYNFG